MPDRPVIVHIREDITLLHDKISNQTIGLGNIKIITRGTCRCFSTVTIIILQGVSGIAIFYVI